MSSANRVYDVDEDNLIEVGAMSWKSEDDYDSDGEPICICGPAFSVEGPATRAPSESPPIQPEWIPLDKAWVEPSLDQRVRVYEAERDARYELYSKWCLEAWVNLASYSLHTDEAGREAFRHLPNWEIVEALVNQALASNYIGPGLPPRVFG